MGQRHRLYQQAITRLAWFNRGAALAPANKPLARIEPQAAARLLGTVARDAVPRQQWPNLRFKRNFSIALRKRCRTAAPPKEHNDPKAPAKCAHRFTKPHRVIVKNLFYEAPLTESTVTAHNQPAAKAKKFPEKIPVSENSGVSCHGAEWRHPSR
jgi:hypothetical protein